MTTRLRRLAALILGLALWAAPSLALEIRQGNTAIRVNVLVVSSTDHTTPLTGASLTVTKSKNGGAFAALAGSVAETANGWYAITLAAGDVDTIGDLILHATAAGADPSDRLAEVVAYDPSDAAGLGLSRLDAAVSTRSNGTGVTLAAGQNVATVGGLAPPTNWPVMAISGGGAVTAGTVSDKAGYSLSGSQTFSTTGAVGSVTSAVTAGTVSDKTGYSLAVAPPTAATIATAVRDVDNTSPATGSLGAKVNTAASAGDPWATSIPGAYASGTAGNILGNRLDAAVSSRSTYAGADTSGTATLLTRIPGVVQPQTGDAFARIGAAGAGLTSVALATPPPTAGQVAAAILASPSNLLATDSSGRVTTTSLIIKGSVVAGSTTTSVIVSGLPSGASYIGQRLYRTATGESKAIQSQSYSSPNYTFTLGSTPGTSGPFGSSPSAGETVAIPN